MRFSDRLQQIILLSYQLFLFFQFIKEAVELLVVGLRDVAPDKLFGERLVCVTVGQAAGDHRLVLAISLGFFFLRAYNRNSNIIFFVLLFCEKISLFCSETHPLHLIALPYALSFLFLELPGAHPLGLGFWLDYFLTICFIFDVGSVGVHGVPVPRVDAWVENTHDTYLLNLYKREEWPFFERGLAEGLA